MADEKSPARISHRLFATRRSEMENIVDNKNKIDRIQMGLLEEIADLHGVPEGAYNIRANGQLAGRNTTANIDIVTKTDKPGIDIIIKPNTKNESVHIDRKSVV